MITEYTTEHLKRLVAAIEKRRPGIRAAYERKGEANFTLDHKDAADYVQYLAVLRLRGE